LPEPYRRRSGKGTRPSPAKLGLVRVDADFADEYPDGDPRSTEAYASLVRAGTAALLELERCVLEGLGIPQPAATMLAVLDGAETPLTPSQISERVLVASASTTATLDLLERRGWAKRTPNPEDRRSTLVEITAQGRAVADQFLAGVRKLERDALDPLSPTERRQLLRLLAKILTRIAELSDAPPTPLQGRRNRPARLTRTPPQPPRTNGPDR
jgi:DNA-binding MarR family transcriptional regulator